MSFASAFAAKAAQGEPISRKAAAKAAIENYSGTKVELCAAAKVGRTSLHRATLGTPISRSIATKLARVLGVPASVFVITKANR